MEDSKVAQFSEIVRPIVTVLFTLAVIVGFLQGKLSSDAFLGIATSAITFWFIQKGTQETRAEAARLAGATTPPTPDQKGPTP